MSFPSSIPTQLRCDARPRDCSRRSRSVVVPSAEPRCRPRTPLCSPTRRPRHRGGSTDETSGVALSTTVTGTSAGTLIRARACYQCKVKLQRRWTPSITSSVLSCAATQPPTPRGSYGPDRPAELLLTGGQGEDRDVHRAAGCCATVRRPRSRHAFRSDAARRFSRRCPTARTGFDRLRHRWHRPAPGRARSSLWRTRSLPTGRSTS